MFNACFVLVALLEVRQAAFDLDLGLDPLLSLQESGARRPTIEFNPGLYAGGGLCAALKFDCTLGSSAVIQKEIAGVGERLRRHHRS